MKKIVSKLEQLRLIGFNMAKMIKQKPEITEVVDKVAEWIALLFEAKVTITVEKGIKKHTIESNGLR